MNKQIDNRNRHVVSGFALIALGAWVALAPFVAGTWAWEWDLGRFLLTVVPGTAVVIGGLAMLGARRRLVSVGGWLALAGGLWLMFGPILHALVVGPELGTTPDGAAVRMLELMPFFFVAGALVAFVSSYAAGFLRPLEFADELGTEPGERRRARVPLPPERPRRQRATRESAQPRVQRGDAARRDR